MKNFTVSIHSMLFRSSYAQVTDVKRHVQAPTGLGTQPVLKSRPHWPMPFWKVVKKKGRQEFMISMEMSAVVL